MRRLYLAVLLLMALIGPAFAAGPPLDAYFGAYVGRALDASLDSGRNEERDIDIVISPYKKGGFRIDFEVTAQIDHGEEEVAELVLDCGGISIGHGRAQFADFFLDLVEYRGSLTPVETDLRRFFLQLERPRQGGQRHGNAVEIALSVIFGI